MASNTENTSSAPGTDNAAVPTVSTGQEVDAAKFAALLDMLDELATHTHIFYDDYTSVCNCNCNCNCTRGIV